MTSESVSEKNELLTHFVKNALKFGELCSNKSDQHHSILFLAYGRICFENPNSRGTIVKVCRATFFFQHDGDLLARLILR